MEENEAPEIQVNAANFFLLFFFFCAFSTQALASGPQLHVTVKTQASWKPADSFLTATR